MSPKNEKSEKRVTKQNHRAIKLNLTTKKKQINRTTEKRAEFFNARGEEEGAKLRYKHGTGFFRLSGAHTVRLEPAMRHYRA